MAAAPPSGLLETPQGCSSDGDLRCPTDPPTSRLVVNGITGAKMPAPRPGAKRRRNAKSQG